MRLVVTGGLGFIGSSFVRNSLRGRFDSLNIEKLTILDSRTYAANEAALEETIKSTKLEIVELDICDCDQVSKIVKKNDAVVHFAAESHVDNSINEPGLFLQTNILGTYSLLKAVSGTGKRLVCVSTDEVYGSIDSGSADENYNLKPSSPYSSSKASADLIALSFHHTYGDDVCISRGANTYGPYQNREKLIPNIIHRLNKNMKISLYGDGTNIREWVHVDDHAEAISIILTRGKSGNVYNITGDETFSNLELSQMLLTYFNKGLENVEFVKDRLGHDFRYSQNSDKIRESLNWRPKRNFKDSISEIVDSMRRY